MPMPKTPEDVRKRIVDLHLDEGLDTKGISERLYEQSDGDADPPSERTIQRIIREIADRYTKEQRELDTDWRPRVVDPDGISSEWVPFIFRVYLPLSMYSGFSLTRRVARWIPLMQSTLSSNPTNENREPFPLETVLLFAFCYATRERWAVLEGEEMETEDIDTYIAFSPWYSEVNKQAYDRTIQAGLAPRYLFERELAYAFPLNRLATKQAPEFMRLLVQEASTLPLSPIEQAKFVGQGMEEFSNAADEGGTASEELISQVEEIAQARSQKGE